MNSPLSRIRTSPRLFAGSQICAAVLVALGFIADMPGPSSVPIDLLFAAAVAIATIGGGWVVGLLWLIAPIANLVRMQFTVEAYQCFVESVIAVGVTVFIHLTFTKLRISQHYLRALLAKSNDVVLMIDRDGAYVDVARVNPSLHDTRDRVGKRIADVFPDRAAEFLTQIRTALVSREAVSFDYELEVVGRTVCLSAVISPISDKTVVWAARDVTTRKLAERALHQAKDQLEERVEERTAELSSAVDALRDEVCLRTTAEDALRESEAQHRSIVEQANEIIYSLDRYGTIVSLNSAFEKILGWKREEWIGRIIDGLVAPDALADLRVAFQRAIASGTLSVTTGKFLASDGRHVILESALTTQVINGETVALFGVARDVTERERQAETLRRSERQLAESQRIAKLGSWEVDGHTTQLWWSEEQYRLFGLDPTSSMTFDRFLSLLSEEDRKKVIAHSDREIEFELSIILPDGQQRDLLCLKRPQWEDGKLVRVTGISQDITDRKRADHRLRESEERFRLVAREANDAVWDWNALEDRIWWSDGYGRMFGYGPDDYPVTIAGWVGRIHEEDRARVEATFREALATGIDTWSEQYRYRRANGTYATVFDRGLISRDAEKRATRMTGSLADITKREQLEEQLANTRRINSLGRVAVSIAHEFNNVLMGIQPNVEVVRKRATPDMATPLRHIVESVRRGKRVTEEILRFTRSAEPDVSCIDVGSFLDSWASDARALLGHEIALDIQVERELYMRADAPQIAQVMTNLALNARDAMTRGRLTIKVELGKSFGSLGFGVRTPDSFIHFRVTDTGTGISRENMAHMFEPLFTTRRGGTGLGLAISHQIVSRHGGHIFVQSEKGQGTTFHVLIPATLPIASNAEVSLHSELHIRRVLLVEDEPAVAAGLRMLLEAEGVAVDLVHTGAEAIAAIARLSPDAVILDIGLPDCDGTDVYREIEKRWPGLPVLFSSGHADSGKLDVYLQRDNVGFLLKPYGFDEFRSALMPLMSRPN